MPQIPINNPIAGNILEVNGFVDFTFNVVSFILVVSVDIVVIINKYNNKIT